MDVSTQTNGQGWSKGSPVRYVNQVIKKLDEGIYPTEPTRCFCGADPSNDTVITEFDRYTIRHRMVLCEACLLMRANPRMTKEAYAAFYNTEYRKIYDGFPYGERSEDDDFLFQQQSDGGIDIQRFVKAFDVSPTSVIDIGCDKGGSLMPFKDAGLAVYGVELCDRGRAYTASKGIPVFSSLDELIAHGVKADLVILQDVIEHLLDLQELEKIKDLLTPNGYVFIYTPGLLATPPSRVFQNAHTFQFIGATLETVMGQLGYVAEFLDDRIVSLWRYRDLVDPFREPPLEWRRHIIAHLRQDEQLALPPVRTVCKFTEKTMLENLDKNLALGLPFIDNLIGTYQGPVVIVGGGPSVDGQLDTIREKIADGAKLMVIERMYPWCTANGLQADFVVSLDASDGIEAGFTHLQPDAIHLMVVTNNPKVFPLLTGTRQYFWCGIAGTYPEAKAIWTKYGHTKVEIVNTGGSTTLAAINLSLTLGLRQVHLFGFDCMIPTRDHSYATAIAGESVDRSYREVMIDGQALLTCNPFLSFAQQLFPMIDHAGRVGMLESLDVYGPSLVNAMATGDAAATWHYEVKALEAVR